MPSPSDIRRLHALLDRLQPAMRREVERAFNKLKKRLNESALLDMLERGDLITLAQAMKGLERDLQSAVKTMNVAFAAGRIQATKDLPVKLRQNLTQTNEFAIRAAQTQAAKFVTGVSNETRLAIRGVIDRAFRDGLPPREAAKLIRPLVGLTKRQAQAVVTRRAADMGSGMAAARVQSRAVAYSEKLLKQRALMIARTEIISASTQGQLSLWREAQAQGLLPRGAEKMWITTPDDRLCPICEDMDGETVALGEMFTIDGALIAGPPAHPNCRCAVGIDAKSIGVRRAA